jgi:hypothetical protein
MRQGFQAVPPENLIGMTRVWPYGSEAAEGRVSEPAAAAIRSRFTRRARLEAENLLLRQQTGGSTTQVPNANETVEHRFGYSKT